MAFTIEIHPDVDAESPREWCNLGILACAHRRYHLSDAEAPTIHTEDHEGWSTVEAWLRSEHGAVEVLPVYMLDHSGLRFSTRPFGCPWDSGQVGFIYATAETIATCGTAPEHVVEVLAGEIETYDTWQSGGCVGFVVTNDDDEIVDSCWGFYSEADAREAAEEAIAVEATA